VSLNYFCICCEPRIYECFYCHLRGRRSGTRNAQGPSIASRYLRDNLNLVQNWLKLRRIKVNENKSIYVTTRAATCPAVYLNGTQFQAKDVKYLGMHLNWQLNWKKRICEHLFIMFIRIGMILFIISEVLSFVSFF